MSIVSPILVMRASMLLATCCMRIHLQCTNCQALIVWHIAIYIHGCQTRFCNDTASYLGFHVCLGKVARCWRSTLKGPSSQLILPLFQKHFYWLYQDTMHPPPTLINQTICSVLCSRKEASFRIPRLHTVSSCLVYDTSNKQAICSMRSHLVVSAVAFDVR